MKTVVKALPLLAASLGMFHPSAVPAAPVPINDYLGNWKIGRASCRERV